MVALLAGACAPAALPGEGLGSGALVAPTLAAPAWSGAPAGLPAPAMPPEPGHLGPSFVRFAEGEKPSGKVLADVETCAPCHADAVMAWRGSAHAFASFNNPVYRVSVDKLRVDVGKDASRHCAGCHDPALLVDGAMAEEIDPDDPRAHAGVTCRTCHGIEAVSSDGNGSFTLTTREIPIPKDGDAESVKAHVARVAMAPLRTAELCASCHRAFLGEETGNPHHLFGMDDASHWARSAYAGSVAGHLDAPVAEADCRGCHMPLEAAPFGDVAATDGKIATHAAPGGHTYLRAMLGRGDTLRRTADMVRGAATIDVAAVRHPDGARTLPADGAPVVAGERLVFDVVVRNVRVGHRFPGGTLDAQDTWIELVVHDARGRLLASAGTGAAAGEDPTAHRLVAAIGDEAGKPLLVRETHKFRAPIYDHTIAARDAAVEEYAFDVPATLAADDLPLRVTATLRHRSRGLALAAAACADARTVRGKAFADATERLTGLRPDPCVEQPITEVARSETWIGDWAAAASAGTERRPAWSRLYDHGLAFTHAVQERLHEAVPSLERALAELEAHRGDGADPAHEKAMVVALLSRVAGREGRTADAVALAERAGTLAPGHPAAARLRGDALAAVWRWGEASSWLRVAAEASPRDDETWARLAVALGSVGDDRAAYLAASRALPSWPRHPDLLRVQALALRALGAPPDVVASALDAYLEYRRTDAAPGVRSACSKRSAFCALERIPVHVHAMLPAGLKLAAAPAGAGHAY